MVQLHIFKILGKVRVTQSYTNIGKLLRREDQMVWISCLMISVISWWLLMEETRVPVENQGPAASHRKSYEVTSKPCHGITLHSVVRAKNDWLRIRIMCLSGVTCPPVECCFSELAL
jgi:hypothetical protein